MVSSTQKDTTAIPVIHPATRLGHVHYTVTNLERQTTFYRNILGFKLHWQDGNSAGLGAGGEDLLRLTENKEARRYRGTTGLYHTAFLVPTQWELAQLLKSIAQTRTPIQGMSNHGTHYAIYLPDAEGNGIELAWDFPQEQWPTSFEEMMRRNRGLPPEEVFKALEGSDSTWEGLNPATKVGHVHLHVADLDATLHFYRDILGFEIPFRFMMDTAIFFSAGGYHHHIGTNVWQGVGAPQPPANAAGLRYYSVVLPDDAELKRVTERINEAIIATDQGVLFHDPAGNGILLTAKPENDNIHL